MVKKINFIKDIEINLVKNDLLWTKAYSDSIIKIIKDSETPFTIGLFWSWWTWKSSIVKTIEEEFNNKKSTDNISVFKYDAWKYSNDSFRRTFLLELKNKFNLNTTEIFDSFYIDKHEEIFHKNELDSKKAFLGLLYLLPLVLLLVWFIPHAWTDIRIIITIISVISTIVFYFLKDVYVQYKISITKPKFFAPEQFEEAFVSIIWAITWKNNNIIKKWFTPKSKKIKKVVIVIDNIDRCHKKQSFELLLSIKNFLESKNVIFLLPIDEAETKKHISNDWIDWNEFLRKIFNTTITVKTFSENDLYSYAKTLNKNNKLWLDEEVLSIVTQEFSKNPRKIIQFLNVLQTEILLINKQQENWNFNKKTDIITNNLPFLVKILLIREEWSDLYLEIKNNPYILNDISEDILLWNDNVLVNKLKLNREQHNFFARLNHINSKENLELFFYNKDSFPDVPDWLYKLIISQDWKSIKELHIKKWTISFDNLLTFINEKFNTDVWKRKLLKTSWINIISLLFKISNDSEYSEDFKNIYYKSSKKFWEIKSTLNNKKVKELIPNFNPKDLVNFIYNNIDNNKILLKQVISNIKSEWNWEQYNLMKVFINIFKNEYNTLKEIKDIFSNTIISDTAIYYEFDELLKDTQILKSLINQNLITNFISQLEMNPKEKSTENKVKILLDYNNQIWISDINILIKKFVDNLNWNNDLEIMHFWLNSINNLMLFARKNKKVDLFNKSELMTALRNKYSFLFPNISAYYQDENYKKCLTIFLSLSKDYYILKKAKSSLNETIDWLNNFYNNNLLPDIYLLINDYYIEIINYFEVFTCSFNQIIINRMSSVSKIEEKEKIWELLNLMIAKTSDEKWLMDTQINSIVSHYISIRNDENKNTIDKWLNDITKSKLANNSFETIMRSLNFDKKLEFIWVINSISKTFLSEILKSLIDIANNTDNLEKILSTTINSKINTNTIKLIFKNRLLELNRDENQIFFDEYINFIKVNRTHLLYNTMTNTIIDKIKPLLNPKNKDDIIFALNTLKILDITDKNKKQYIKTLLNDINSEYIETNEEKELLKEIQYKVKK